MRHTASLSFLLLTLCTLAGLVPDTHAANTSAGTPVDTPAAAPLACGDWTEANGEFTLHVLGDDRARLDRSFAEDVLYRYRVDGDVLWFHDMESGGVERYTLSKDGALRGGFDFSFRLKTPAACETAPTGAITAVGACRADLGACIEHFATLTVPQLDAACDDGVLFACRQRLEQLRYGDAARTLVTAEPPVCREGTATYNAQACVDTAMAQMDAGFDALPGMFSRLARPVAADTLERYTAICIESRAPVLCREVGEALLVIGLHAEARGALVLACRGGDNNACQVGMRLREIPAETLQAVPLTTLPCGRYTTDFSLLPEFTIDGRGRVTREDATDATATLVDGALHLRGEGSLVDVFHAIGDGRLLAVDGLNRFGLYTRSGDAPGCAAR